MKVIALRNFKDLDKGKKRKMGETFIVSKARFKEINSTQHGALVEEVVEAEEG